MTTWRLVLWAVLITLGLFVSEPPAAAQIPGINLQQESSAQVPPPPDPRQLQAGWWDYFIVAGKPDPARVAAGTELLRSLADQASTPAAQAAVEQFIANLNVLSTRTSEPPPAREPEPVIAQNYTLTELISLEQQRLDLADAVALERGDTAQLATAARGLRKRIDTRFTTYLTLAVSSPERLNTGLMIMAERAALAVAQKHTALAEAALSMREASLKAMEKLIDNARSRLRASEDNLASLAPRIKSAEEKLESETAALRAAEDKMDGGFATTDLQRARARLGSQRVVHANARRARAQSDLYRLQAQRDWIDLRTVNSEGLRDETREAAASRVRHSKETAALQSELRAATERELLNMSELSSADTQLAKLTQQRLVISQETLLELEALSRSLAQLDLVNNLVSAEIDTRLSLIERGVSSSFAGIRDTMSRVGELLGTSLFRIGETPVTTLGILRLLLILFVALWISRLFRGVLQRFANIRTDVNQSAFYTIGRLAHYVIIIVGLMVGLASIGLNLSNLALVAGALSVGIGFGLQSIVNNFVSGLIILFERSLNVGDFIELDAGLCGTVKEINVRSTLINTNDNIDIVVPNSEFVSSRLTNWTLRDVDRRVHISFGVAYGSDKELVRKVVLEAATKVPHTLLSNPRKMPQVWLVNFGDSSLDFELVAWLAQASVRSPSAVNALYLWEIETALGEAGIEIPFPQRDLHLRSGFSQSSDTQK